MYIDTRNNDREGIQRWWERDRARLRITKERGGGDERYNEKGKAVQYTVL